MRPTHLLLMVVAWLIAAPVAAYETTLPADSIADTLQTAAPKQHKYPLWRRIIRGFDRLDTAYIEPQHYTYTAMLQTTNTYDLYTLSGIGWKAQSLTFSPDLTMKVGPYLGWKWVFAGYTFEIGHFNPKSAKREFDLSIYSSQVGVDLFWRKTGSDYKIRDAYLGERVDASRLNGMPFSGISAGITGFNLYYIFNHGRFSYPAAFSQSTVQKISCGSWMAGVGYTQNSLSFDYDRLQQTIDDACGEGTVKLDDGLKFTDIHYSDLSLSAGYAYNWVFAPQWLFAASLQAALAYKKSKGDVVAGQRQGFRFENINFDGIGRFGVVYNNMRWYSGLSIIVHSYNYRKSRFATNNTFGSMNLYWGYNFGLKKKYRPKDRPKDRSKDRQ